MQSGETALRKVDPYHLLFEGGQFYLVGHSHERDDVRMFRLSRIRGKVAYATKAEHDFQRPADFDPREYAGRVPWQLGDTAGDRRRVGLRRRVLVRRAPVRRLRRRSTDGVFQHRLRDRRGCSSRGRSACASTRASRARPSWSTRRASGSTGSSSATAASRRRSSPTAPPRRGRRGREPTAAAAAASRHDPARALRPARHARVGADRRRPRRPRGCRSTRSASS